MARSSAGHALTVALVAWLGGCAPREPGVTLRFWAMGREGEVVEALVRDFERETPGVRVVVQQLPWSAAHEKFLTAYVGRSSPDLAMIGNTWVSEFNALRAIAPVPGRPGLEPEGFFPGIWDTNVIDGVAYGVPWYVDTRLVFYRRDLLAKAGYAVMPSTWTDRRRAMQAVRDLGGPRHYAIFLPTNEWMQPMLFGLQNGSPLLADGATRGAFSQPAFREAFRWYVGLFADSLAPALNNNGIANLYQEFDRGTFAMYITGPWNLGEFRARLPAERQPIWATAPLPGPRGPGLSAAGGASLVVFRQSRHAAEAWQLIEFLSRPEQQLRFWRLCGSLPARREAWADTALTRDANTRAFGEQLQRTASWPKLPEWEQIAIRLQDYAERAILGGQDPDSVLVAFDREVAGLLEKRRWLASRRTAGSGAGAGR